MRNLRRLRVSQPDNFEILRSDSITQKLFENLSMVTLFAAFIAFITLLGAAIGLMNIMLVSVTERTTNPELIYNIEFEDIEIGQTCELGSQLRPFIVWFGEAVPMIEKAVHKCADADILIVVGTSLQVYPAAGLIHEVPSVSKKYIIDPEAVHASPFKNIEYIKATATEGLPMLVNQLLHD